MTVDQLKDFHAKPYQNNELLKTINNAAKAYEIAEISHEHGFQFSGDELKAISKSNIPRVKIMRQDTSPSYSFGENGH